VVKVNITPKLTPLLKFQKGESPPPHSNCRYNSVSRLEAGVYSPMGVAYGPHTYVGAHPVDRAATCSAPLCPHDVVTGHRGSFISHVRTFARLQNILSFTQCCPFWILPRIFCFHWFSTLLIIFVIIEDFPQNFNHGGDMYSLHVANLHERRSTCNQILFITNFGYSGYKFR
jgi:hypothetical protein